MRQGIELVPAIDDISIAKSPDDVLESEGDTPAAALCRSCGRTRRRLSWPRQEPLGHPRTRK